MFHNIMSIHLLSSFPLSTIVKPLFIAGMAIGVSSTIKGLFLNPNNSGKSFIRILSGIIAYLGIIVAFGIVSSSNVLQPNENSIQQGSDNLINLLTLINVCLIMFGCIQFATAITIGRNPFIGLVSFIGGLFMYGVFKVMF